MKIEDQQVMKMSLECFFFLKKRDLVRDEIGGKYFKLKN